MNRLAASAANDVMTAKAHLNSLQASLGGTEGTAHSQNMARIQLQAMESNAASTRTMYEAFVQRLRQAQGQDDIQTPESRIISGASVPLHPAAPKRGLIFVASIPLGLLLGVLAALLVEKLGPLMPVRVNGAPRAAIVPPIVRTPRPVPQQPRPKPPCARCGMERPAHPGRDQRSGAVARRRFRAGLSGQQIFPRHGRSGAPA